jgi:hypothetical protein
MERQMNALIVVGVGQLNSNTSYIVHNVDNGVDSWINKQMDETDGKSEP